MIFSSSFVKLPLVLKCLRLAALVAAQLIPLALCQKVFSTDLTMLKAQPPVIQPIQIVGNKRIEGRVGRHTFLCVPVVWEPEVKPGIFGRIRPWNKGYVEKTKTEYGCRFIPMTEEVYQSLKNILAHRKQLKTEMIVDGYRGFILLDKDDKPKVALHIENEMRWAMKKYKKLYPNKPLPHITPHVFRHTFCTNMASAGKDIKNLQYIMGHSDVGVMLNVYTHASYDRAAEQMSKIIDFKGIDAQGKRKKSG